MASCLASKSGSDGCQGDPHGAGKPGSGLRKSHWPVTDLSPTLTEGFSAPGPCSVLSVHCLTFSPSVVAALQAGPGPQQQPIPGPAPQTPKLGSSGGGAQLWRYLRAPGDSDAWALPQSGASPQAAHCSCLGAFRCLCLGTRLGEGTLHHSLNLPRRSISLNPSD